MSNRASIFVLQTNTNIKESTPLTLFNYAKSKIKNYVDDFNYFFRNKVPQLEVHPTQSEDTNIYICFSGRHLGKGVYNTIKEALSVDSDEVSSLTTEEVNYALLMQMNLMDSGSFYACNEDQMKQYAKNSEEAIVINPEGKIIYNATNMTKWLTFNSVNKLSAEEISNRLN